MSDRRRSRPRRMPLIASLAANGISQFGSTRSFVAVPWFVLETTGSPAKTGITDAVRALPVVVAGIFGGALIDRLGYKRISVLSDVSAAAGVAAIPLLSHTTGLSFWQLLILVFAGAGLSAPGATARRGIYRELTLLAAVNVILPVTLLLLPGMRDLATSREPAPERLPLTT